jgi:hypothetical protein
MPGGQLSALAETLRINQFRQKSALKGAMDRMPAVTSYK